MPRPALFTDEDVLDAALAAVHRRGRAVTVADVADALGGPTGSIYHRFPSRTDLLARLWLRSIARFQAPLLTAVDDAESALSMVERAARHVPTYCREHPDEARALSLFDQRRLLGEVRGPLRDMVGGANAALDRATRTLALGLYGAVDDDALALVVWATRSGPYGLVRPYLGLEVPERLADAAGAAATAIVKVRPLRPLP